MASTEDVEMVNQEFCLTVEELKEIMEARGEEGAMKVKEMGGVAGLVRKLRSDERSGLTGEELELRREVFGSNTLPKAKQKTFLALAWEALKDPILLVLVVCAGLSMGFSFHKADSEEDADKKCLDEDQKEAVDEDDEFSTELIEGLAILLAVVIVVFVTAVNDWKKEKQFRGLQDKVEGEKMVSVIRIGDVVEVQVEELVVGDLMMVKYGDLLAADGLVVQASELSMDESALTGESNMVKKNVEEDPFVLAGTKVMEGSGKVLVTAVGLNSQSGMILTMMGVGEDPAQEGGEKKLLSDGEKMTKPAEQRGKSVLATKLARLAKQIGLAGFAVSVLTVVVLVTKYCVNRYQEECAVLFNDLVKFLITGVTILVVAIPEGLPLAVTLALAYSVRKMMDDNNLVRHLDACETMGNATTICTDKTGTLTTNRMTVVASYMSRQLYFWDNLPSVGEMEDLVVSLFSQAISFNSSYSTNLEEEEGG
jgi:Ca2+ transporting ATPase